MLVTYVLILNEYSGLQEAWEFDQELLEAITKTSIPSG